MSATAIPAVPMPCESAARVPGTVRGRRPRMSGDKASYRQCSRPPVRRIWSAQPSSPPTTPAPPSTATKVAYQPNVDSGPAISAMKARKPAAQVTPRSAPGGYSALPGAVDLGQSWSRHRSARCPSHALPFRPGAVKQCAQLRLGNSVPQQHSSAQGSARRSSPSSILATFSRARASHARRLTQSFAR